MKFKAYIPYSKVDLHIMEELGTEIEYFYPTLEELIEEHGVVEWSIFILDDFTIDIEGGVMTFDDIREN